MIKELSSSLGWWALLLAVVLDLTIPYMFAPFYNGYSHRKMVMSSLGNPNSPVKVFYNIWLEILGFLLLYSTFTLFDTYKNISRPISILMIVFLVLFAVGACILSGLFSVNESKNIETSASKIHGFGSVIGFMALLFVPFLLSLLSFQSGDKLTGSISIISFILAMIFFVLFVMADKPEFQKTIIVNIGLWQRLTLLFMYLPIAHISVCNLYQFYA